MNAPQAVVSKGSSGAKSERSSGGHKSTSSAGSSAGRQAPRGARQLGQGASSEAGLRAAAILEVLAGERTPQQAAAALSVSVPYFYLLERQALTGLVQACEPRPKGPAPTEDLQKRLAALEHELRRSQRECQRQAALVRATQRAVGLPATPTANDKPVTSSSKSAGSSPATAGKRRRRRPVTRALLAAKTFRHNSSGSATANSLQPSVMESGNPVPLNVPPGGALGDKGDGA